MREKYLDYIENGYTSASQTQEGIRVQTSFQLLTELQLSTAPKKPPLIVTEDVSHTLVTPKPTTKVRMHASRICWAMHCQ